MFRYKLQQFMSGRYGVDEFSFVLLLVDIIVSFISVFFRRWYIAYCIFRLINMALLIFIIYRMLSRDISRRSAENDWYLRIKQKFRSKRSSGFNCDSGYSSYGYDYNSRQAKKVRYKEEKKMYKYFKCPNCSTKLRVPRGKGKLNITCPKCHTSFKGKS